MDSMSVLGEQSQNKIQSDYMRLKNEENRIPGDPRPSKNLSAPQFFKKNVENKNLGSNGNNRSRLPVLAKSLNLHISKEFAQSHKGWEDQPLAGKAVRSKKPCTKPMPFNFSQPRSKGREPQSQRPSRTFSARAGRDENTLSMNSNRSHMNAKTPSEGFGVDFAAQPSSAQRLASRKPETLKATSTTASMTSHAPKPMAVAPEGVQAAAKTVHQKTFAASAQASTSQASTESCLNNLDLLSIKEPTKQRTLQASDVASSSSGLSGKEEAFQLDHAALLSILRNEGVGALRLGSATPGSTKPYNYNRVTIAKSHQKAGPNAGPMRVALDPAAKRSTLHGEGPKAGGTLEKTPSNPVRHSGRGTSVYTARRVPVTRPRGETPGRAAVGPFEGTPAMKWTPQRVPNTRNQLMSGVASMHKTGLSARPVSHKLQACPSEPQQHHEDVVQRLFEDEDNEQNMTDSDEEPQSSTTEGLPGADGDPRVEEEPGKEDGGVRPFLQEPGRESVIFFSTGKKLFRAPRVEKPEGPAQAERRGDAQAATASGPDGRRPEFDPAGLGKPFASVLQRDFLVPKNCQVEASPATALLLKRRLLLDELRLDEEVAAYTCGSAPQAQPFQPPRPRCGNPLASFLHFQDATMFVPVGCEGGPSSTSPLRQR